MTKSRMPDYICKLCYCNFKLNRNMDIYKPLQTTDLSPQSQILSITLQQKWTSSIITALCLNCGENGQVSLQQKVMEKVT